MSWLQCHHTSGRCTNLGVALNSELTMQHYVNKPPIPIFSNRHYTSSDQTWWQLLSLYLYSADWITAMQYLSDYIQCVTDSNRRHLRSFSLQLVIRCTQCPMSMIVCFQWLEAASEQSATHRHLSSNVYCFSEPPQDLPFSRPFPS